MSADLPDPILPPCEAEFLMCGLAIGAASRDAANRPSSGRVLALRISPDRRTVTAILVPSRCPELLRDIRASGQIALACCQVGSNRTLQLKGRDARVGAIEPQDFGLIAAQTGRFVEDVMRYDALPEAMVRTYVQCEPHDLAAISFSPYAVFAQTPGPNAGVPLT